VAYGRTIAVGETVEEAIPRVEEALREQGFGVLTTIDVQATLKAKLNADVEPYVILGACNPRLAHRALELDPDIGLLLPCNVVVRRHDGRTIVSAIDPEIIADLGDHPDLAQVAEEAGRLLDAALDLLER
jgi:uncharacterized protein (DUF302 family)